MSKRKRDEGVKQSDAMTDQDFRLQRRIMAAFTQSSSTLAKEFKLARGFERQKLGRRKREASKEKDSQLMNRIDAEVLALKALDMDACARHHLSRSLLKIKTIQIHPDLPKELTQLATIPDNAAALNVNARLCNSNPVKKAFPATLADVKREFGVVDDDMIGLDKKRRLRAKDYDNTAKSHEEPVDASIAMKGDMRRQSQSRKATPKHEPKITGIESESENFDQFYQGRLASSGSDSENDSISGVEDLESQLEAEGIARKQSLSRPSSYNHAVDMSLSESQSEEDDGDVDEERPQKVPTTKKSSFIPSLTMGGYISGSGSDIEDDVDEKPKKNRRGQRARQQIWEKKFGSRAKHLQNSKTGRSSGWDLKRGAVGFKPRDRPVPAQKRTGANEIALGRDRREPQHKRTKENQADSGPLHPSWEAAKRAKEKRSMPVSFQGKKTSFD